MNKGVVHNSEDEETGETGAHLPLGCWEHHFAGMILHKGKQPACLGRLKKREITSKASPNLKTSY